ncbi:hypothetical protein OAT16_04285 [Prolixibacteraceae bacterium]|nr:hypothetical protein [Prolixibacteraceae bacterium]
MALVLTDTINKRVTNDIKALFTNLEGSHDWLHISRVWHNAQVIQQEENEGCLLTIFFASILHDVADPKLKICDYPWIVQYLDQYELPQEIKSEILFIIEHISFSKQKDHPVTGSINFQIVQDADRLDAIGAIGIARAFAYGGSIGSAIYDESYPYGNREAENSTLDHFYAKLFQIEEKMNTTTGKSLARERTSYMEDFVRQLNKECNNHNILK